MGGAQGDRKAPDRGRGRRVCVWVQGRGWGMMGGTHPLTTVAPAKAGAQGWGMDTASNRDVDGHLRSHHPTLGRLLWAPWGVRRGHNGDVVAAALTPGSRPSPGRRRWRVPAFVGKTEVVGPGLRREDEERRRGFRGPHPWVPAFAGKTGRGGVGGKETGGLVGPPVWLLFVGPRWAAAGAALTGS